MNSPSKKARNLIYDIETCPALGLYFGKPFDVRIAKTVQHEYVFGFAWQWEDEPEIHTCYIWDFPEYNKKVDLKNVSLAKTIKALNKNITAGSKQVLKVWSELVNQADYVTGHNSDSFDYKQMHGRLIQYKLPPIHRPQFVDTKKMAKRLGYYDSNSLDNLSNRFGNGGKMAHDGIDMWWACMNGDKKARQHMVDYNIVDVEKTLKLYHDFRPYDYLHPNVANITNRPDACPKCGSEKGMVSEGTGHTKTGEYRTFKCKSCHTKTRFRKGERNEKPKYV